MLTKPLHGERLPSVPRKNGRDMTLNHLMARLLFRAMAEYEEFLYCHYSQILFDPDLLDSINGSTKNIL